MESTTLRIAECGRMSDLQLVLWGHPLSQHVHHIDYFVSSDIYEMSCLGYSNLKHCEEQASFR